MWTGTSQVSRCYKIRSLFPIYFLSTADARDDGRQGRNVRLFMAHLLSNSNQEKSGGRLNFLLYMRILRLRFTSFRFSRINHEFIQSKLKSLEWVWSTYFQFNFFYIWKSTIISFIHARMMSEGMQREEEWCKLSLKIQFPPIKESQNQVSSDLG